MPAIERCDLDILSYFSEVDLPFRRLFASPKKASQRQSLETGPYQLGLYLGEFLTFLWKSLLDRFDISHCQ
jgi:hypothetical protein